MAPPLAPPSTLRRWLELALRIGVCLLVSWWGWYSLGPYAPLVAPIWGVMLAKPIIEFTASAWRTLEVLADDEETRVYQYGSYSLRCRDVDGEPWFVDRDVLAVIGEKPTRKLRSRFTAAEYARLPGTRAYGFSRAGIEKLMARRQRPEGPRLRIWLEHNVFQQHRKRQAMESDGAKGEGS